MPLPEAVAALDLLLAGALLDFEVEAALVCLAVEALLDLGDEVLLGLVLEAVLDFGEDTLLGLDDEERLASEAPSDSPLEQPARPVPAIAIHAIAATTCADFFFIK